MDDDSQLNSLFASYRVACPDREPSVNFMPNLWAKIEARHSFWSVFQQLAKGMTAASAALCLLLLVLNLVSPPQAHLGTPSYTEALMADHTAEKTDYTEAIRSTPTAEELPVQLQQH